ncbi:MAG: DUF1848 domain-containing protein [Deltaproteobacteria bacterium]|nr:MAG: DUF1848 domain-containing protein [Deltaproteobacteria bacterium]
MMTHRQVVISASRRTDIPGFYMPWFMQQIKQASVETVNPYNLRTRTIPLAPRHVHSIVFWSKNFGPFIDEGYGERLRRYGYRLFFNFTINSESRPLEPNIPPLDDRLGQLETLCTVYGPEAVTWRFDPVCFYKTPSGHRHNLADFERIADVAARYGIRRCITSFRDDYKKIDRRTAKRAGFRFIDPPLEKKVRVLTFMAAHLAGNRIDLYTCCEKAVLAALPPGSGVKAAACIDHHLLARLYGEGVSFSRDTGQRRKQGCGCHTAVDIGDYRRHPCYHDCLFCYANPVSPS